MNIITITKSALHDEQFERVQETGFPHSKLVASLIFTRLFLGFVVKFTLCRIKGHDFVDFDAGDPETGPCTDVFCVRCGREL